MKVLILGAGNIGSVATKDLAETMPDLEIVVSDKDKTRARKIARKISNDKVTWTQTDVMKHEELVHILRDFDLVMGFLPGRLGYRLAEVCIEAEKDLVDVSYMAEDPLKLHKAASKASVAIIPDCGLAPGISNVLVGHAAKKLQKVETVHIMVGGLPQEAIPPLGYTITWSPESLIDEYTRRSNIVKGGRKVEVDALSGLEKVVIPPIGTLEAFYTDGLRTLLHTIRNAHDMWEKTLRYPGHAEKIELLKALGFFDKRKIKADDANISPRKLTARLFEQKLVKPEIKDIVVLEVKVTGIENNKRKDYSYRLLDSYDSMRKTTAMARTTAYPMSIVAQLILKKAVKNKGVIPPENIGMNDDLFRVFIDGLHDRGIAIASRERQPHNIGAH